MSSCNYVQDWLFSFHFIGMCDLLVILNLNKPCKGGLQPIPGDGMAAMGDDKTKGSVIQHGYQTIVFWISRDWLQTIYTCIMACAVLPTGEWFSMGIQVNTAKVDRTHQPHGFSRGTSRRACFLHSC